MLDSVSRRGEWGYSGSLRSRGLYNTLLSSTWEIGEEGWDYLYGRGKLVLTPMPAIPLMLELGTTEQSFNRSVVIRGSYFGSLRRDSKVLFSNGITPEPWHYMEWSRTEIEVRVPTGSQSGDSQGLRRQSRKQHAAADHNLAAGNRDF